MMRIIFFQNNNEGYKDARITVKNHYKMGILPLAVMECELYLLSIVI